MSLLKSYTCSKCAGVLMFDSDQEFFDCPFCGNRFDAADFHEDEIMAQAGQSLREGAFSSAREKFNSILDKEPSDFEALKGLVLCEIKASVIESLESPDAFDSTGIAPLKNLIARLKRQASSEDSEFFNQLLTLLDLSDKLKMYQNSLNALYTDSTRESLDKKFKVANSRKRKAKAIDAMFAPVVILGAIAVSSTLTNMKNGGYIFMFSLIGMLVFCVIWAIFRDYNPTPQIYEDPIQSPWELKIYLDEQIAHFEGEYKTEFEKLLELDRTSTVRKFDATVPEENQEPDSIADTDHPEAVICSKCSGRLFLDKQRRVYECQSCGVAYGISLFYGMPMEKALKAMNTGRYGEAKKRFENALMVEPSNFDALLGQILCVGGWTRISDIDTSDVISEDDCNKIWQIYNNAKLRVPESDKDFFDQLEKLISMLGKICVNNAELDVMNKKIDMLDSVRRMYSLADQVVTGSDGVSVDRNKTISEIERLGKDTRQLSHEFLDLKRSLMGQKSDCILVK